MLIMRMIRPVLLLALLSVGVAQAEDGASDTWLLADFETEALFLGKDSHGLDIGFVPWGDAPGNVVLDLVTAEGDLALPEQAEANTILRITYNINAFGGFTHALTDGEEWVPQDWSAYTTLNFWLYGAASEAVIQVEIFDNRAPNSTSDTAERWYYRIVDDFSGWQFFSIPFAYFQRRAR
jgi:hypothetical protein